jgi:hypothetical protein
MTKVEGLVKQWHANAFESQKRGGNDAEAVYDSCACELTFALQADAGTDAALVTRIDAWCDCDVCGEDRDRLVADLRARLAKEPAPK